MRDELVKECSVVCTAFSLLAGRRTHERDARSERARCARTNNIWTRKSALSATSSKREARSAKRAKREVRVEQNLRDTCASRRISLIRSLAHVAVRLLAGPVATAPQPQRDCNTRAPRTAPPLAARVRSLFCFCFCLTDGRCSPACVCALRPYGPSQVRASHPRSAYKEPRLTCAWAGACGAGVRATSRQRAGGVSWRCVGCAGGWWC